MAQTTSVREGVLHRRSSWFTAKFLCLAGLDFKQRRQRKLEKRLARRVLVLPSSEFEQLFEEGPTEKAYAGTPVGSLTQHEQGRICQEWARKGLQEQDDLYVVVVSPHRFAFD